MLDMLDGRVTRTKEKRVETIVRKMKSSPNGMLNMNTWA